MKILYIAALVSFAALAWAALAITRHIQKGAAALPVDGAENELSHALEARLGDLSKHPAQPREESRIREEQDFSYFNRDPSAEIYPTKTKLPKEPPRAAADHR